MGETLMVGMSEIKVTRAPDAVLTALGLGSCVGICAYDAHAGIAGLAHVVLPDSAGHEASPGKFANTAVPLLLDEMTRLGATAAHIRVVLTGGAQLFAFNGSGSRLEIGPRNTAAVEAALQTCAIPIVATDVGGNSGRTVQLMGDGRVRVRVIGQSERELARLGDTEGSGAAPGEPRQGASSHPTSPGLEAIRARRLAAASAQGGVEKPL